MAYRNKITERFGINKVINYMCKTETKEQIPVGIRCYDTSRGIKKPVPENISYDENSIVNKTIIDIIVCFFISFW